MFIELKNSNIFIACTYNILNKSLEWSQRAITKFL